MLELALWMAALLNQFHNKAVPSMLLGRIVIPTCCLFFGKILTTPGESFTHACVKVYLLINYKYEVYFFVHLSTLNSIITGHLVS